MENQKIAEIKKELDTVTPITADEFIRKYVQDERVGVQNLVKKANKLQEDYKKELARTEKMKEFEYKYAEYTHICGIDEAGRGPLAGPVVAGAVILPKDKEILYLNDSKQLSAKKREELYDVIMEQAVAVGVGVVSPETIDDINILQATYQAMRMAIDKLSVKPDMLMNDAVTIPEVHTKQIAIIKGDAKSISIAAASIIAKVTRDRMMIEYDKLYPQYHFSKNKGYGSKEHTNALKEFGPCPIHRRSFIGHFVEV